MIADSKKILIVDDEEDVRALLLRMLRPHGFQIKTANGSQAALNTLEDFQPNLLITDIKMPGMDGMELARVVKKLSPHTAIIIMTAYASTDTAIGSLKLGADDYIKKPIKLDELADAVRAALDKQPAEADKGKAATHPQGEAAPSELPDGDERPSRGPMGAAQRRAGAICLTASTKEAGARSPQAEVSIGRFPFRLGREPYGVEPVHEVNTDFTIRDEPPFQVSRSHCSIEQRGNGYYVHDSRSRLGTIVNGARIGRAAGIVLAPLKPGKNTLILGNNKSAFVYDVIVGEEQASRSGRLE